MNACGAVTILVHLQWMWQWSVSHSFGYPSFFACTQKVFQEISNSNIHQVPFIQDQPISQKDKDWLANRNFLVNMVSRDMNNMLLLAFPSRYHPVHLLPSRTRPFFIVHDSIRALLTSKSLTYMDVQKSGKIERFLLSIGFINAVNQFFLTIFNW